MLLLICNRELMFILSEKHRQDNAPQGCTTILIGIMSVSYTHLDVYKRQDYDREGLNAFFATLKEEDFEVVVVRSLNEITDDIYDCLLYTSCWKISVLDVWMLPMRK